MDRPLTDFDRPTREGLGVTHTNAPHAALYRLRLTFTLAQPLVTLIRATSHAQAIEFARARHPTLMTLTMDGPLP